MAAPTRVNSLENSADVTTTYTVALPGSRVTDNLLVIICATAADTGSDGAQLTMTGDWTKISEVGNNGSPSTSECLIAAWYRVITGGESATYDITSAVSTWAAWTCIQINGVDTTTPIHIGSAGFGESQLGAASTQVADQITTTVDDCYLLCGFSFHEASDLPGSAAGTGWSEYLDADTVNSGTDDWDAALSVSEKTMSGQGTTGDVTYTPTTVIEAAWFQIAIAPAAGTSIPILQNYYRQQD